MTTRCAEAFAGVMQLVMAASASDAAVRVMTTVLAIDRPAQNDRSLAPRDPKSSGADR